MYVCFVEVRVVRSVMYLGANSGKEEDSNMTGHDESNSLLITGATLVGLSDVTDRRGGYNR